ncbi:HlyD family efflux transporter periplasmic adaptor subunit [uncultured Desulfobacter sp.]|uniref:HlyD family efflux transporter periplasmic adaptor subunit n=1 Tax=uncultured Desulfobacter sp. TaxID=240139 RepID=UPI002AABF214|nr:HlyD family efflux transporter periplasmic adaptor subunit [uncultured Desulfobacter sp.]
MNGQSISAPPISMIRRTRYSMVLWVLILGFTAAVAWACYFQVDQTIRGMGTVIASSRVQVIQAVDGGVLKDLNVKEGDRVARGEILALFDQTRFAASVEELDARLAALYAQASRLRAEITGAGTIQFPKHVARFPELISVQKALFKQRCQGFRADMENLETTVRLAREESKLVNDLALTGDASRSEVIRAEQQLNNAQGDLINRKNKYYQDIQLELSQVEDHIGQDEQIRTQRAQQLRDSIIRAPVPGIVKNVRITTLGGVLRPGEELMQIVPVDDQLIVEAKIRPADIADICPGLSASLRFDAFDSTIFGSVEGTVKYVSADTLKEVSAYGEQTYYRVHLATQENPVPTRTGKTIDILQGMTAQVDIRTGRRTVLDILLKPLRKTLAESFREK